MPSRMHARAHMQQLAAFAHASGEVLNSDTAFGHGGARTPETLADARVPSSGEAENGGYDDEEDEEEQYEEEDEFDQDAGEFLDATLPPSGLKDISSLASWTVSTSKQGCGIAALRSSDTSLFWQSDGPQPHTLSIHFFKLVSIAHMRIFLDHESDESYTPTKMQFWAGMGVHDLQEFAEMTFEQPKGWIDVDFGKVGPAPAEHQDDTGPDIDWSMRPTLRAFLVQVRIIENHQNGKDTHLRGLQIFTKDQSGVSAVQRPLAQGRAMPVRPRPKDRRADLLSIRKASWMLEPELR